MGHNTQHTTHSTSVCQSSWSDSTRHTAPANRLSATTSLVCWLLGMVPGCLGWHALGQHLPGVTHARQQSLSSPCSSTRCSGACLAACLPASEPACGLGLFVACGLVARPTGLDSGICLRPSVVVTPKDRIDRQTGWGEVAKLPGYKSQRLTRPQWPQAKAQTPLLLVAGCHSCSNQHLVLHTL